MRLADKSRSVETLSNDTLSEKRSPKFASISIPDTEQAPILTVRHLP
ncbi:MAG TPA: hypothetical protein V6D12_11220 [Candidatus Obscuribacterales bacterium]